MKIFCLACTYIVQTYNYSRVKKKYMNIFHTCNHHGGYCLWINRQIYTGMLKIGTLFLGIRREFKKLTMQKPLLMDCTYAIGKS